MKEITLELEKRRKELKMTYREIAKQTGLMVDTVRNVLHQQQEPAMSTVIAIASTLGMRLQLYVKGK